MIKYDLSKKEISVNNFSPFVTWCAYHSDFATNPPGNKHPLRPIYDYEIEYFQRSEGAAIILDGTKYPIENSDIVFKRPGMINQGIAPYTCYVVCFDLIGEKRRDNLFYMFHDNQQYQCNYVNSWLDSIPTFTHIESPERFNILFQDLRHEFIKGGESSLVLMKSYMLQLLYNLHPDSNNSLDPHISKPSAYHGIFIRVCDYIESHLNENLNLNIIAEIAGLDPFHFHKLFTKHFEITPLNYITGLRIEKAKHLLIHNNSPISEIAEESGFPNFPYFCSLFKQYTNTTPSKFRKYHKYI